MHSFKFILVSLLSLALVQAAPTSGIDSATLLKNGQEAQKLNAQYKTLSASDSCSNEQLACLDNAIARCVDSKWDVSSGKCERSQKCFALPSNKFEGVDLLCTSEKNALSILEASGVPLSDDQTGSATSSLATPSSTTLDASSSVSPTVTDSATPSATAPSTLTSSLDTVSPTPTSTDSGPVIVFVTVTVTISSSIPATTLPAQTRTLSPDAASSVISSILAGATASSSPVASVSANPSPSVSTSTESSSNAAPTTFFLTAAPATATPTTVAQSTASAPSASGVSVTAADPVTTPEVATPAATTAPSSGSGDDYNSGYGGYY